MGHSVQVMNKETDETNVPIFLSSHPLIFITVCPPFLPNSSKSQRDKEIWRMDGGRDSITKGNNQYSCCMCLVYTTIYKYKWIIFLFLIFQNSEVKFRIKEKLNFPCIRNNPGTLDHVVGTMALGFPALLFSHGSRHVKGKLLCWNSAFRGNLWEVCLECFCDLLAHVNAICSLPPPMTVFMYRTSSSTLTKLACQCSQTLGKQVWRKLW